MRGVAVVAVVVAVAWSRGAVAQDAHGAAAARTSSLSWVRLPGAEVCAPGRTLARAVEQRLGRRVFVSTADADVAIEGRVERADDRWRAVLVLSDRGGAILGRRTVESRAATCDALTSELGLVIAVMIDPDAALARHAAHPEPGDAHPAGPPVPAPRPRVVVRTERVVVPAAAAPRLHVSLEGFASGAVGLLPAFAPGLEGDVRIAPPGPFAFELEGALFPYASLGIDGGPSATAAAAWGGLLACVGVLRHHRLSVDACAGAEVGILRVTSSDPSPPVDVERWTAQLVLRGRVAVGLLGPLSAVARPALVVPLRRAPLEAVTSSGSQTRLFAQPAVGAVFDLGLELTF